jgi:hypothetical protein
MSQDYLITDDLLQFITCEDAAFEEIFSEIDYAEEAVPPTHLISNVLSYSKVLNISHSNYLPEIEIVLN